MENFWTSQADDQAEYDLPSNIFDEMLYQESNNYGVSTSSAVPDLSDQQDFSTDALPSSVYDYYPGDTPPGILEQMYPFITPPTSPSGIGGKVNGSESNQDELMGWGEKGLAPSLPPRDITFTDGSGGAVLTRDQNHLDHPSNASMTLYATAPERNATLRGTSCERARMEAASRYPMLENAGCGDEEATGNERGQRDFGRKYINVEGRAEKAIALMRRQRKSQLSKHAQDNLDVSSNRRRRLGQKEITLRH